MKDIYVLRASHFLPTISKDDELYESILRQSHVLHGIAADLITTRGIEHLFGDNMDVAEAHARNRLLTDDALYRRMVDESNGHMKTECDKDNIRYVATIRRLRASRGLDLKFYQTEPQQLSVDDSLPANGVETVRPAMLSLTKLPLGMLAKGWYELFSTGTVSSALDMWVYLRDQEAVPVIQEHAGPTNLIRIGRLHQLAGLYKRKSGFRVIGVSLSDDLSYQLDSANLEGEMPIDIDGIVQRNVEAVRTMSVASLSAVRSFRYSA
jgi:hypothetical protein